MASHNYHRFESRFYEKASSFHTVWRSLTQENDPRKECGNNFVG
jgi:hypothetical protein